MCLHLGGRDQAWTRSNCVEVRTIDEGGRFGVFPSFTKKCLAALGISASRKRLSGSDVCGNGEFELAAPGGGTLHISGAYKSDWFNENHEERG